MADSYSLQRPWSRTREALLLGLAAALIPVLIALQMDLEATSRQERGRSTLLYVPPAKVVKRLSLGFQLLAADFFWLRAIQYYGEGANAQENYRWLYPVMDLVTDLDPAFRYSYKFAGVAIPYDRKSAEDANAILRKGMGLHPDVWQLPFYIGYNYYTYLGDYAGAARFISQAAKLPGAPSFLAGLAGRLYGEAGNPETALEFLMEMYNSLEDELLRRELEGRIRSAVLERDLKLLNMALKRFEETWGRPPENLRELVARGILVELPKEPFGGSYYYDRAARQVETTNTRERLRLYREKS